MSTKAWRFAAEWTQSWGVVLSAEGNRRVPVGDEKEIRFDSETASTVGCREMRLGYVLEQHGDEISSLYSLFFWR